ncbi:MAG: glycosyltransferase [Flavobacterium sp.]
MSKNILVAPLNWGLGHATRCIPIIYKLIENGYTPIIASDGVALQLLQKEFPKLKTLELPSYQIKYAKKGFLFLFQMMLNLPNIIKAVYKEQEILNQWIVEHQLNGVISDNRLGLYSQKIPSVFITHQINVFTGFYSKITTFINHIFIKKYQECWVPDVSSAYNLSGKLGHTKNKKLNLKYIGILSRLEKVEMPKKYDVMILLSGPEPQRTMLEEKLLDEFQNFEGKLLFVKGKMEQEQIFEIENNNYYYNYMTATQISCAINKSDLIVCRSGYSTVLDLVKLQKKAFFIPTPGQTEQLYLAKKYHQMKIAPFCYQDNFKLKLIQKSKNYTGFSNFNMDMNLDFTIFENK